MDCPPRIASSSHAARDSRRVGAALAIAVASISFAAIFFRKAAPTHPLTSAGLRLAIAAALVSPLTIAAWRQARLSPRERRAAILAGFLYAVHFGAWVASLGYTTVAASVTLVTATPLLVAVVSLATGRDRPGRQLWTAIAVSTAGIAVIAYGSSASGPAPRLALLGNALALLGAAGMAGYLLVVRRLGEQLDAWSFTGIATAVGAVLLLGASVAIGVSPLPASGEAFAYLVLAALVPQIIGHTSLTWALRHARPTMVGIATVGEPAGATALGWLWLGEVVPPVVAIGCVFTLIGVVLATRRGAGA